MGRKICHQGAGLMKGVIHLAYSDNIGGASRAAYRIHSGLIDRNVNSKLWVIKKLTEDPTVISFDVGYKKIINRLRYYVAKFIIYFICQKRPCSLSLFNSRFPGLLNVESKNLIVHLHWVQGEMLSIYDISKIKQQVVWSFHDIWPINGVEHLPTNKALVECGAKISLYKIIDDLVRRVKARFLNTSMVVVCPSCWLANEVRKADISKKWTIEVIPNPIDTKFWRPLDGISVCSTVKRIEGEINIAFGSFGDGGFNKGYDLLVRALDCLDKDAHISQKVNLVMFGNDHNVTPSLVHQNVTITNIGFVDSKKLLCLYNLVDLVVVPSRVESFGLIAAESQACGTPVVAFSGSGLDDVINHKETGYLSIPYNVVDFAKGIVWTYRHRLDLKNAAINKIRDEFDTRIVSKKYNNLYKRINEY
jgi:glycosyltransferase involved in cell wall biosynthesis